MAGVGWKRVRWSQKKRAAFLDHLMETCNVRASAEAAGVPAVSVYHERRRNPAFAEGWREALAAGYEILETRLVGHALEGGGGRVMDNGGPPVDVQLALTLLNHYKGRGCAGGKTSRGGARPQRATREETDKRILGKLAAIERRLGLNG